MKRALPVSLLSLAAAVSLTTFAPDAAAEESRRGIAIGARVAYGAPMGSAEDGLDMANLAGGMLILGFDAGYRFNPHWYVGGSFQWGVLDPPSSACGLSSTCNGSDYQLGLSVHYHVLPNRTVDPWVGLGFGYEQLRLERALAGADSSIFSLHGFQLLNLQAGADLKVIENVPFGPYVGLSLTQFSGGSLTSPSGIQSDLVFDTAMHEWVTVGVRGQFQL